MLKPAPVYDVQFVLRPEQDASYVHFENAAAHPFRPDPPELPRVNVWWLIEAALLSYWDPAVAIPVFNAAGLDAEFVEADGTQCYVAWQTDWLLVAFRGTEGDQWGDILTDARFAQIPWKVGLTHAGFTHGVRQIQPKLTPVLNRVLPGRKLWFCGHSLGAALATLAADLYPDTRGVCTFGTPRIGDRTFSVAFSEKFAGRSLRYANGHDVVTHVPPPVIVPWQFKHVAPARFISQSGHVSTQAPQLGHFFTDLFGRPETLLEVMNGLHCGLFRHPPRCILDHMPKAYAIWAWNDYETHG